MEQEQQSQAEKNFIGEFPVNPNEPTSFEPPDPNEVVEDEDTQDEEKTQDEEVDTKVETSEDDTTPEPTDETEIIALFNELGLGADYKDPADVLKRIREHRRYITQLEQKNSDLSKSKPQEEPKTTEPLTVDGDAFYDNPLAELKRLGFVSKDEAVAIARDEIKGELSAKESEEAGERYNEFVNNTTDFHKVEPYIDRLLTDNPALRNLAPDTGIKLLYKMAKVEMLEGKTPEPKTVVEKADADKKERASTGSGKNAKGKESIGRKTLGELSFAQQNKMSIEEIEEQVGFGDD